MESRLIACLGLIVSLLALSDPASAGTCVWSGNGGNNKWSTVANWGGATCVNRSPQNGDNLTFPDGAATRTNVNDLTALRVDQVLITGNDYHLTGNGIILTNAVIFSPPNLVIGPAIASSIDLPMQLAVDVTIINAGNPNASRSIFDVHAIDLHGFSLTLDTPDSIASVRALGPITGSGAVNKLGTGTGSIGGTSTYTGQTHLLEGELDVLSNTAFGATGTGNDTIVSAGATLALAVDNLTIGEALSIQGTGNTNLGAIFANQTHGTLTGAIALPASATIVQLVGASINVTGAITGVAGAVLTQTGGTLIVANAANKFDEISIAGGTLQLGAAGAIPDTATIRMLSNGAIFDLHDFIETVGPVSTPFATPNLTPTIKLGSGQLTINEIVQTLFTGSITGTGSLIKIGSAPLNLLGPISITGPLVINDGSVLALANNQFSGAAPITVNAAGALRLASATQTIGSLSGSGRVDIDKTKVTITEQTPTVFSGVITGTQDPLAIALVVAGTAPLTLSGANTFTGTVSVPGQLVVDGSLNLISTVSLAHGALRGSGTVGPIVGNGSITPGVSLHPGVLHADSVHDAFDLTIDLDGPTAGSGYDQLALRALAIASDSTLSVGRRFNPRKGTVFTIVTVAGGAAINGRFFNLPEGATMNLDGQHFQISYVGGNGNDITLTAIDNPPPISYYLSEGATGAFFDEDVLIANPNDVAAPITLTFSKENGEQVVATRSVPAQSRLTVHVDQIPGMEATAASTTVRSDDGLPLSVERSMFWDANYYAGHTGSAVDRPNTDWFFAEGSQGFFQTYVLVINPNATPTNVTFTFFRENDAPVTKVVPLAANTRLTLDAGTIPDLVDRSFGIKVTATQPIMAERSMYFGTTSSRLWSGGTESAGSTVASTHWFFAEGATGGFFDTFILLSNPQNTPAQVSMQYLLDTGETVTVPKTIPANTRLTTNIAAENDARLHNAAVSTVVTSDVPIIAERSMYWPGAAVPWGEGHNSFGVLDAALTWGLAEGRVGGPLNFHTYILLANPQSTVAEVTLTYLREGAGPLVVHYSVPATSRFNIDTVTVPGLANAFFGAQIEVTNNVPIIVERSMYWDSQGFLFSGGTNATATKW